MDLGKQIGPLPLGAWIIVVGGGLGIAWYSKTHASAPEPQIDTSGQPGVGDGSVGGWVPTSPQTGTDQNNTAPTTNEEWAYKAKQYLIAKGYDAAVASSAIDKYVNGLTPSIQEYTLVGIALAAIGPLPQTLPTGPTPPDTPSGTTGDANMPYPVNQRLTKVSTKQVTMQWETVGRGALVLVRNSGGIPVPLPFGTKSYSWRGLNKGPHHFDLAYVRGGKQGPWHSVPVTL